jgi:hypothetical protein
MTSNMIRWTESSDNNHRGEDVDTRRERARSSFAGGLAELQRVVDQLVAAGASRAEIACTPAFRSSVMRTRAFRGELAAARL